MPLVAAALLVHVCGLLAAPTVSGLTSAAAGAGIVVFSGRRSRERLALAAIGVAGVAAGAAWRGAVAECEGSFAAIGAGELTLASAAEPGAFVAGHAECGARIRIAVRSGSAAAGAVVRVQGTASRARGGLVIADADVVLARAPGLAPRMRAAIGRGIDLRFGSDAPLVRALLIADMDDLSPDVRNRFSAAGLSHMLSVSGLHVGLIAVAMLLLAQLCRLSAGTGRVIVVVVTAAYVVMIGAPLPAVRSAIMLAAASASTALQRPTSPWAVLAVGACAPLLDPAALADIGYQLSVAGMVALVAAGALPKRWPALAVGGWRGTVVRGMVASVAATLLTAPIVAATFGRVSLVAPVSNLVAVPVMALLQPMLFLAAALLPVPAAAQFVADACRPMLAFIDAIASLAARLPGASVDISTDGASSVLAMAAAAAVAVACVARHPGRPLVAAALCGAMLAWRPMLTLDRAMTEVHMIDVGQGDAIGVRTSRGRWLLFDAGREWEGGDAGTRDVVPYIRRRGGSLHALVLSHPHADHVGGAASVVRALRPAWYFDPAYAGTSGSYRSSLLAAREAGTGWRRAHPGDSLVVDEVTMTVLAPAPGWADSLRDPNEASIVVRVRVGDFRMIFTGDAEAREEDWLVANSRDLLRADVLKVGHHGSSTSSTPAFLDAVRPRLALISVGAGNMYRHPSAGIVRALGAAGAVTLRTDRVGSIVVRTDGRRVEVEASGERWPLIP